MLTDTQLKQAITYIKQADGLLITAGAGMGVDSGLPDFRGNTGFWQAYPGLKSKDIQFSDIANPAAFEETPARAWGFYGHRLNLYRATEPHDGYRQLLQLGQSMANGYFVYTSNVDGQFQKSGFDPNKIVECHGSIHHLQCNGTRCAAKGIWPADEITPIVDEQDCRLLSPVPTCPGCQRVIRPNILMFGDWSWNETRTDSQMNRYGQWRRSVTSPVIIECGAGTAIPTIRSLGERLDAPLIRINTREAYANKQNAVCLEGPAKEAIAAIVSGLAQL
jgi:NAD-dependent SIR2 family protein deacetylase